MGLGRSEADQEIIKPLSFKAQQFKRVVLDNKLEFLLVSDPELDKAGAAVDVSFSPDQTAKLHCACLKDSWLVALPCMASICDSLSLATLLGVSQDTFTTFAIS